MMISLTVTGNPKALAGILASLDGEVAKTVEVVSAEASAITDAPKKRGRPPKAKVEETVDDVDTDTDTDDTSDDENEELDLGDDDEEAPKAAKSSAKALTEKDVVTALQAFVKRHGDKGRERAHKLLAKFKVKAARELKTTQYAAFVAALKG